ncbi:hypothetical protein V8C44DRAFT_277013 [Trichoderma aethiopicum]
MCRPGASAVRPLPLVFVSYTVGIFGLPGWTFPRLSLGYTRYNADPSNAAEYMIKQATCGAYRRGVSLLVLMPSTSFLFLLFLLFVVVIPLTTA